MGIPSDPFSRLIPEFSRQLFYLCCDVCRQHSNPKDSRAFGKDIWNIFLDRNAVRAGIPHPCGIPGIPRGFAGILGWIWRWKRENSLEFLGRRVLEGKMGIQEAKTPLE